MIASILFWLYGGVVILIDAFGVWKPRVWIEWTERQFVYRRERIIGGVFFLLLGLIPIYWVVGLAGWQAYVLSILSGIWIILGLMILAFPEAIRNLILSLGGLDDKIARGVFIVDALFGVVLVLIGVLI